MEMAIFLSLSCLPNMKPAIIFLAVLCSSTVQGDFLASPLNWISEKGHKLLDAIGDRLPGGKGDDDTAERTRREAQPDPEYVTYGPRPPLPYSSRFRLPSQ